MNKYLAMLVALVVALFTVDAMAYTPPPAPANGWYVVDQAGKMTENQIVQLNQKIDRISKATKNEFGVLLLQDMGGDNIEDVANATYKAWGVGKKGLDNGCLIVVAIKERKSRIETGKGVEGEVTDLQTQDILKKSLNPHLKSGDFYGGFDATLDSLSGLMESRIAQKALPKDPVVPVAHTVDAPTTNSSGSNAGLAILLVFGAGIIVFVLVLLAANARSKREEEERAFQEEEAEERRQRNARDRETVRQRKLELDREDRERSLRNPTPNVDVPSIPSRGTIYNDPPKPSSYVKPTVVATAASIAAAEASKRLARKREMERMDAAQADWKRQEEESRRRRERDEEDRKRRDEESSSSSSSGWGSSSSDSGGFGGGSDSGGGFGGGDSGGGGSSSDW